MMQEYLTIENFLKNKNTISIARCIKYIRKYDLALNINTKPNPREFERKYGINGISQSYNFPFKNSYNDYVIFIVLLKVMSSLREVSITMVVEAIYAEFAELNEELHEEKLYSNKLTTLMLIICSVNIDDIRHNCSDDIKFKSKNYFSKNEEILEILENDRLIITVEKRINESLNWIPSNETLKKIIKQIPSKKLQKKL